MKNKDIVIYRSNDGNITLDVNLKDDTVWLNRKQLSELFDRDIKTIGKHIGNAKREELEGVSVVANFATTAKDGKTYQVEYYNLDMVLSVGYRVKSKRGTQFRIWANSVLKQHLIEGYTVNQKRLEYLKKTIQIMKRSSNLLDSKQVLDIIESYDIALNLLDDYDHGTIKKPIGTKSTYILDYDECIEVVKAMRFTIESKLFGREKDSSFKSSISAIYQTFDGVEVYPSIEEKAGNLLYFIVKNHSFVDGNKRIAAAIFVQFLGKSNILYRDNIKVIDDKTLVALTILIAQSKTDEKELMIKLVMNFLVGSEE